LWAEGHKASTRREEEEEEEERQLDFATPHHEHEPRPPPRIETAGTNFSVPTSVSLRWSVVSRVERVRVIKSETLDWPEGV